MSIKALHQSILTNLGEVQVLAGAVSLAATDSSGITKGHPYYSLYHTVWKDLANYDAEKHENIKYVISHAVELFERAGSPSDQEEPLIQVLTRLDTIIRHFMSKKGQLLGSPDRVTQHGKERRQVSQETPANARVARRLFADISESLDQK